MPFPSVQRVMYRKNPLSEVICQLRFPSILSIDTELPAQFQERIRQEFPLFRERAEIKLSLPRDIKNQASQLPDLALGSAKNFEFISADEKWQLNLTNSFLAMTGRNYERWEDYKNHLQLPFDALVEVYKPTFFTRIGLRYRNIISRSKLGLSNVDWQELLRPSILGLLSESDVWENVQDITHQTEIQLEDDKSLVRAVTGLVENPENNEICFLIDNDFFMEGKVEPSYVLEQLDYFNQRGSRLIRWCISDQLHEAMEPFAL